ncbi:MAG: SDR family oxidoreductase [Labilithrix sp.]|nr:SDR family oxidoreductase [Labilithrix sp.]
MASAAPRIVVTGAAGSVGCEVVRALVARGERPCAVDLSARDVAALHGREVESAGLDYRDHRSFRGVLRGCSTLFLVRPPTIADMETTLLPLIDAAVAHEVGHVVFLSVVGADTNALVPHHAVEKHLVKSGLSHTLLRPGFFAQNLGASYRSDIADDDRLYLPAGRGRVAFVDIRDVAEAAAAIILDPGAHRGAAYTCTGPEALSFEEAARLITDVIGRPIRYESASIAGYVRHLHHRGLPLDQIAVQTILHVGVRFGQGERIDPTLEMLLGRRPRTLAAYVRDSADLFASSRALSPTRPNAREKRRVDRSRPLSSRDESGYDLPVDVPHK